MGGRAGEREGAEHGWEDDSCIVNRAVRDGIESFGVRFVEV